MKLKKGTVYFKSERSWKKAATESIVYGYIIYRDYIELTEFEKSYDYYARVIHELFKGK